MNPPFIQQNPQQVELATVTANQSSGPDDDFQAEANNGQNLSPADGGLAAWRLLVAAFVFEAFLWGM